MDEAYIDAHLTRLGDEYYAEFSLPEVVRHIRELSRLSADRPVAILVEAGSAPAAGAEIAAADALVCTILAADYAGLFSLITGVFAAGGFTIDAGAAYTYGPAVSSARRSGQRRPRNHGRRRRRGRCRPGTAAGGTACGAAQRGRGSPRSEP